MQHRAGVCSSSSSNNSSSALPPLPEVDLPDGVSCWTAEQLDDARRRARTATATATTTTAAAAAATAEEARVRALCQTIDSLGVRSQRAQAVPAVLTSVARLRESATYRLYLLVAARRGVGVLKMGTKKLFVVHPQSRSLVEVDPLCVLDFYVDEACQRRGYGRQLFDGMLQREGYAAHPERLAIDRPSDKFVHFLAKHYHLVACHEQRNHFVVYDRFFDRTVVTERGQLRRLPSLAHDATSHDDKDNNNKCHDDDDDECSRRDTDGDRENVVAIVAKATTAAAASDAHDRAAATHGEATSSLSSSCAARLRPRVPALVNTPMACVPRLSPTAARRSRGSCGTPTPSSPRPPPQQQQQRHELCAQHEQQLEQKSGGRAVWCATQRHATRRL